MNNELVPQPSWWKKNWLWVIPLVGCLTIIIMFFIFIGSIFYGVTSVLEESQPYQYALEKINQDDEITDELGWPIKKDGFIISKYNYNNGKKTTKLSVPVSGPKGSGTLFVEASFDSAKDENWIYDVIRIEIKDHENIDLIESDLEDF